MLVRTDADFTDVDEVVDVLNALIGGTGSLATDTGDSNIFAFVGSSSTAIYLFTEDDGTDTTFNAGDLQLLGTVADQLVVGDFAGF